jgi:hypothetical protein
MEKLRKTKLTAVAAQDPVSGSVHLDDRQTHSLPIIMSSTRKCGICREPGHNRSNCPAPKKPADMTPEERHAHQMATNPAYAAAVHRRAAWREIRAAYRAGDRSTPDLLAIQAVMDEADDLKARLTAATTVAEFQACVEIADVSLWTKAYALEWRDEMAGFFITDTRNWTMEAVKWLQWAADTDRVRAYEAALAHEEDIDYVGKYDAYKMLPQGLCTSNLEEARKWALDALAAFVKGAL